MEEYRQNIRAFAKGASIVVWMLSCAYVAWVVKLFSPVRGKWWMMRFCFRGVLRIIGVKLEVQGTPSPERPLLLVSNHTTYLDILILGAVMPVHFTPKMEINGWPVIGWLCRLMDCVFIDRSATRTTDNRDKLRAAFEQGGVVSLFPEGTTNDGKRVLPFRSSYFGLAEEEFNGKKLAVQPAAIGYNRIGGIPIDTTQRPKLAWYGDMDLVPHVGELLRLGPIHACIRFLPVLTPEEAKNRKLMAQSCQQKISDAFQYVNCSA